jgi:hypothetical protein
VSLPEKGMTESEQKKDEKGRPAANRMPDDSVFYEKIVPILLIGLAAVMVILILVAAGVLLGLFR